MSKRTKLKLRNMHIFLQKYVFNSKYMVRDILAMTVLMTIVAMIVGVVSVVSEDGKSNTSTAIAAEDVKEIYVSEEMYIDEASIDVLMADFDMDNEPSIEANKTEMVANARNEFDSKLISTEDNVNVREKASEDSAVVGKLNKSAVAEIVSADGDWFKIKSGDVTGYVNAEYVVTGEKALEYVEEYGIKVGTITGDGVNVRSEADASSEAVETAYNGMQYSVIESEEDSEWVSVVTEEGKKAYIYAEFISVSDKYREAVKVGTDTDTIETVDSDNKTEGSVVPTSTGNVVETTTEAVTTEEQTTEDMGSGEVTVPTTSRASIALSDADVNLMAAILTLECGGESYEGQLAVANVIINRMQNGYWGSSVSDVIYAQGQFSTAQSGKLAYYLENGAQASCIQAVREAAAGTNNIGSFMYFRTSANVSTDSYDSYTIIGNHLFY